VLCLFVFNIIQKEHKCNCCPIFISSIPGKQGDRGIMFDTKKIKSFYDAINHNTNTDWKLGALWNSIYQKFAVGNLQNSKLEETADFGLKTTLRFRLAFAVVVW